MQIRERNGVRAIVEVQQQSATACSVSMRVEQAGRALWANERNVSMADSDRAMVERTAIEAAAAIADHLVRRHRLLPPR